MLPHATPELARDLADPTAQLAPNERELVAAAIAHAKTAEGWTLCALPAPLTSAAALANVWTGPLACWSSSELTLVGLGAAHQIRARGRDRWRDVIVAAAQHGVTATYGVADDDRDGGVSAALARVRWLGGLAWSPGAADLPPWDGFGDAWWMLPRWTYVRADGDAPRACWLLVLDRDAAQRGARWLDELARLRTAATTSFTPTAQPAVSAIDHGDRAAWRSEVRAITDAIATGAFSKVVPARTTVVSFAAPPRIADVLTAFDARHPECFRVALRPDASALVAATPERLLAKTGAQVRCDALAGSIARDADPEALRTSTKDRHEHELVVHAIALALREQGADVVAAREPAIRVLRHLAHLHTPITARLRTPRHVLELAAAMHPTPAVGGTPRAAAVAWIGEHEQVHVPRGWYASPVGWFDSDGDGELAVAIRSGVLRGERAHLWAGAGVVAGSDPERELAETDLKLRAMLGALGVDG